MRKLTYFGWSKSFLGKCSLIEGEESPFWEFYDGGGVITFMDPLSLLFGLCTVKMVLLANARFGYNLLRTSQTNPAKLPFTGCFEYFLFKIIGTLDKKYEVYNYMYLII